jgi:hypothetical protein
MNQDMHMWVAMLLMVLTVMFIHRKHYFYKPENQFEEIALFVQLTMPVIFFGIWLYRIC